MGFAGACYGVAEKMNYHGELVQLMAKETQESQSGVNAAKCAPELARFWCCGDWDG